MLIKGFEKPRKAIVPLTAAQEYHLDREMDRRFRSQRPLKNGRNFLWDRYRFEQEGDMDSYRRNFDGIKWAKTPPAMGL
jgi:hypothetical protein